MAALELPNMARRLIRKVTEENINTATDQTSLIVERLLKEPTCATS